MKRIHLAIKPLSTNLRKMVKYTQTIRQQQPTSCLVLFDHFVGLALKGLKGPKHFENK